MPVCAPLRRWLVLLTGVGCALPLAAMAAAPLWQATLPAAARWHRLTGIGTLLAGAEGSLLSVDPDNGRLLWQREDIRQSLPYDVREIDGMPLLVVGEPQRGSKATTRLTAINFVTGETAWRTEPEPGTTLAVHPVPDLNLVAVFELAGQGTPDGVGLYVRGLQADDGHLLWRLQLRKGESPLLLHRADTAGTSSARQDLSGHPDPVVADGVMYIPFGGLAALDLASGRLLWDVRFDTADKNYKRAYPAPVVDGDLVFAGSRSGSLYAIERGTGKTRWQTPKLKSGFVSQLVVAGDAVLARLGGNFYSQQDKRYRLVAPLGVIGSDKASGQRRWEYLDARDGITNLVYQPGRHQVAFADGQFLIGLDVAGTGQARQAFRVPIEFKRKVSGSEAAATGLKMASGFLGGGLASALQSGLADATADRLDVPVAMQEWPGGALLVRGQQHLLMFDPARPAITWSTYYPAPGVSGFALAAMAALTVASTAASAGVVQAPTAYAAGLSTVQGAAWGGLGALAAKRYSASADAGRYTYVLTDVEEGGKKGVGIMAVDMATGAPARQILLGDKEPDYRVDDVMGRLYYLKGHREVRAYALR